MQSWKRALVSLTALSILWWPQAAAAQVTSVEQVTATAQTTAAAAGARVMKCYQTDAVGNVRVVTNEAGEVIERHDYLPFGEECTTGPCANNPGVGAGQTRKFTGKERDVETGLDYFGARYYRANVGRFTTVDPVYLAREPRRSTALEPLRLRQKQHAAVQGPRWAGYRDDR